MSEPTTDSQEPTIPTPPADPEAQAAPGSPDDGAQAAPDGIPSSAEAPAPAEGGSDAAQSNGAGNGELPTEGEVYEALEEVIDPELGLDFVSLGLVYDVDIEKQGDIYVTFTLTTPACPIGPQVSEQMKEYVGELDGVKNVFTKMIFDPPWSPEMMSEDAKFALGF